MNERVRVSDADNSLRSTISGRLVGVDTELCQSGASRREEKLSRSNSRDSPLSLRWHQPSRRVRSDRGSVL